MQTMNKINIETKATHILGDLFTPVGVYMKIRDKFRDSILLESADFNTKDQNFSFIGVNPIAGIEVSNYQEIECKLPNQIPYNQKIPADKKIMEIIWDFFNLFQPSATDSKIEKFAQGFYGYFSYDAIPFFEDIELKSKNEKPQISIIRFRLYQYIIVFNHFKDEISIVENKIDGLASNLNNIIETVFNKEVTIFPFQKIGEEKTNITDEAYINNVQRGIAHCKRGDVFQIVLSRRFSQNFHGDELNVYRQLRSINPSPYLFYFDYGNYRLFGSSPEAQLIIQNQQAYIHPIAGTVKRTGNESEDLLKTQQLQNDPKENAEHVMLVDLARNDLSIYCDHVEVINFREIQNFSHVIHLVSIVKGSIKKEHQNPLHLIAKTFPAGTLSGAPKYKAMELIDDIDNQARSFYGGAVGFIGLDGTCNLAIIIRSLLSKENTLFYQAGGGIVASSIPANEQQEVFNKLNAIRTAIHLSNQNSK